jgi:anti-anti-sigma factor
VHTRSRTPGGSRDDSGIDSGVESGIDSGVESGVVVHLDGAEPGPGLAALRAALVDVLRSGVPVLLVDIAGAGRLSSTTVSALLSAQRRCRAQGGSVVLRGVGRRNRRLLDDSGLSRVFDAHSRPARPATTSGGERSS